MDERLKPKGLASKEGVSSKRVGGKQSPAPKRKPRHLKPRKSLDMPTKSICKHITLEIPIPQDNRGMTRTHGGVASTVSMAPVTQTPLLGSLKPHQYIKSNFAKGSPHLALLVSEGMQGEGQRLDSPYTHNFEQPRSHLHISEAN